MPSTYTPRLRVEKQALGENQNSWGDTRLNRALEGLEEGIAGLATITLDASDVTLTSANASADQARMAVLRLDGTPAASRNIIVPGAQKTYWVDNTTGVSHTIKTSGGTGAVVGAGRIVFVYCDGTNCRTGDITADLTSYITVGNASGNRLINGDGRVSQRSVNLVADDSYGDVDRWNLLVQSGSVVSARDTDSYGFAISPSTTQRVGTCQIVENKDILDLVGGSVTLSGVLQNGTSGALTARFAILAWAGTADAVTSDVVSNWASTNYTPGNFFISTVSVVATGSVAMATTAKGNYSITGTVPSNATNLIVVFWTTTTIPSGDSLVIRTAQLERGSVATPFARRPYGEELALCQRYYQPVGASGRYSSAGAAGIMSTTVSYTPMRATPTVASIAAGTRGNTAAITLVPINAQFATFTLTSTIGGDTYALGEIFSLTAEL